jgi:hypothetical protein
LRVVGNGEGLAPSPHLEDSTNRIALGAEDFFRILYGDEAPGFMPIFTHTPNYTRWVEANSLAEAGRVAVESGRELDTYFGIGLQGEVLGEFERGTASGVIALPGVWADLDIKGEAHKAHNLPSTGKDAMRITEAIPIRPTLVVHSGHGLQVWWLFKELWIFEYETERNEAQELSRRFQATLRRKAKEYGWRMDGTHDISRVFRPPGTLNHKLEPVEVRVVHHDEGARYNPADFEPYLVGTAPDVQHEVNFEDDGHEPRVATPLLSSLSDRLSPRVLKAIEGGPDAFEPLLGGDGSPSGADASVCQALVEAGLTDAQIRAIFRTFPIGTKGKYAREGRRGDDYLALTIKSQRQWAAENRNSVNVDDGTESRPEEIGQLLSEVQPEQLQWLWERWLALYKLVILEGDPGLGKSALILDLGARLSAGLPFPDGFPCEPAGVVLISAEDGLADTIRPRLDAAGADTSRIVALATVKGEDGYERFISIPEDIPLIEQAARRVGAKLIVVDPLMAFLSSNVNSYRDQDVRRALAPLSKMAERLGTAVVVIRHPNKGTHTNPLYRGGGSIGIIGAARMAFLVAKDPQDEERRVLAPTKNNLARAPKSLMFALKGTESGAVRVNWLGESEVSAEELLATPQDKENSGAQSEAIEFVNDVLSDGPVAAGQVKEEAEDAGISERTLARAKKKLKVKSYREGESGGRGKGLWLWKLPVVDLVEHDTGCHQEVKDAKSALNTSDGILNYDEGDEEREFRVDLEDSLRMPTAGNALVKDAKPIKDAKARLSGKSGSLSRHGGIEHTDHENLKECGHGFPNGKGCYLCDPDHPYRKKGGAS